jgi:hypothetical protein
MTQRPGASLANPAPCRVTAVEFASNTDDTWPVLYFRPVAVLVNGVCRLPGFSGHPQAVSVAVPEPATIDVILAFFSRRAFGRCTAFGADK